MAYNSAYTGPQVDEAVGAVRAKASTWDDKQDKLSGTEDQLVGFNSAGEAVAVAKPTYTAADVGAMPAVSGGSTGQVLTKTEAGQEWQDSTPDRNDIGTERSCPCCSGRWKGKASGNHRQGGLRCRIPCPQPSIRKYRSVR